ncbi:hypothetical protein NPIL_181721 [Nephila pilipes]|uniref:Reverse transcriptase domain-containing protein n=1 Tax=Nephila pilipes TaxID=299642 RepID=A0A8X6PFS9_NEPPI|nr:hypothetical protein NPIL_181721 [Nephila pilipes]
MRYRTGVLTDISCRKGQRCFQFMWSNGNIEGEQGLITYRFKRVLFGINACPFLLSAIIKKRIEQFHSEHQTATSLLDFCLYVDDFIAGEDSVQDALGVPNKSCKRPEWS